MLSISLCFANPFIMVEPMDNITDFYIITVDKTEPYIVESSFDSLLLLSLYQLKLTDGRHRLKIQAGNLDGESSGVQFYLIQRTKKNHIVWIIKKIKNQIKNDPYYDSRFEDPLSIRIPKSRVLSEKKFLRYLKKHNKNVN